MSFLYSLFGIGYDRSGYDKEGYDRAGYDKAGYDKEGYDKAGYDRAGYDKAGYDKEGYDKAGYDKAGYDKEGYDRDGYDDNGLNREGWAKDAFKWMFFSDELNENIAKFDKNGFDWEYCSNRCNIVFYDKCVYDISESDNETKLIDINFHYKKIKFFSVLKVIEVLTKEYEFLENMCNEYISNSITWEEFLPEEYLSLGRIERRYNYLVDCIKRLLDDTDKLMKKDCLIFEKQRQKILNFLPQINALFEKQKQQRVEKWDEKAENSICENSYFESTVIDEHELNDLPREKFYWLMYDYIKNKMDD